jgi:hypothetical protein
MTRFIPSIVLFVALVAAPVSPLAALQDSNRTQALAKELTDLLQQQKLDAMAARLGEDQFAAVLYIPGVQLLVVSARYTAPVLLNERILTKQYREAYLDLASASVPDSKLFIEDMQGNGLRPRRDGDDPFDVVTKGTAASFPLDGDHRKKKISEEEYRRQYADFEGEYEKILTALIAEGRKSG